MTENALPVISQLGAITRDSIQLLVDYVLGEERTKHITWLHFKVNCQILPWKMFKQLLISWWRWSNCIEQRLLNDKMMVGLFGAAGLLSALRPYKTQRLVNSNDRLRCTHREQLAATWCICARTHTFIFSHRESARPSVHLNTHLVRETRARTARLDAFVAIKCEMCECMLSVL